MPRLMLDKQCDGLEKARDEVVVFLGEYGSYLRMDTCLAYAAVLKADTVVDLLLGIAKHDPRHREMIKQTTKSTSMVFYEPVSCNKSAFIVRRYRLRLLNRHVLHCPPLVNAIRSIATVTRNPDGNLARAKASDH